ncbi:MAG: aryl-sulfate sulfotransferase [Thermodesulfobacteriota bacterium]
MLKHRSIFWSFCSVIAVAILGACGGTLTNKAFIYKEPVRDSDIHVDIHIPDKAFQGTTLLADNHRPERPRIIEIDIEGRIIWEYVLPHDLRRYTNPGFDVERLPNDHILFVLPLQGVYEISRSGDIVWSYINSKVSHDADRLPNGNTLVVFGGGDRMSDPQVKEIDSKGEIVWAWYARDHFNKPPYKDIYEEGWTHTNAASRLPNGNTLISPRNFDFVVEVDPRGEVVRKIGEGICDKQHDPVMLPNGHILFANHKAPHRAIELDLNTCKVVWQSPGFERDAAPVRDADRLPNGNTLVTGTTKIVEFGADGQIVWQLRLRGVNFKSPRDWPGLGFYKAERIAPH